MNARVDYYRLLHVQPSAPVEIIRSSYRTLMQRLESHPDLGGDHSTAALLNEAYAVLTDAERRAAYDRDLGVRERGATDAAPPTGYCLFCEHPYASDRIDRESRCARCASPLYPAKRHRLDPSGQRMLGRIRRSGAVRIKTRWSQLAGVEGQAEDLSLNGMRLLAREPLDDEHLVKIESDFCEAIARVAHCRASSDRRYVVGLEFLTLRFTAPTDAFVPSEA